MWPGTVTSVHFFTVGSFLYRAKKVLGIDNLLSDQVTGISNFIVKVSVNLVINANIVRRIDLNVVLYFSQKRNIDGNYFIPALVKEVLLKDPIYFIN